MPAKQKPAGTSTATGKSFDGFSDDERAAMKDHAQELKTAARRGSRASKQDGEGDVRAKIAEMQEPDRALAERLHTVIMASVPGLEPKLWYGMPAYAKGGQLMCFFQTAQKFKTRYATLGFSDKANLDDGTMWPISYALPEHLSPADETRITGLIKQAVS